MCVKLALCNTNHKIVFQSICLGHVDVIPFTDLTQIGKILFVLTSHGDTQPVREA